VFAAHTNSVIEAALKSRRSRSTVVPPTFTGIHGGIRRVSRDNSSRNSGAPATSLAVPKPKTRAISHAPIGLLSLCHIFY